MGTAASVCLVVRSSSSARRFSPFIHGPNRERKRPLLFPPPSHTWPEAAAFPPSLLNPRLCTMERAREKSPLSSSLLPSDESPKSRFSWAEREMGRRGRGISSSLPLSPPEEEAGDQVGPRGKREKKLSMKYGGADVGKKGRSVLFLSFLETVSWVRWWWDLIPESRRGILTTAKGTKEGLGSGFASVRLFVCRCTRRPSSSPSSMPTDRRTVDGGQNNLLFRLSSPPPTGHRAQSFSSLSLSCSSGTKAPSSLSFSDFSSFRGIRLT